VRLPPIGFEGSFSFGISETALEMLMLVGGPSSLNVNRSAFSGLRFYLLKARLGSCKVSSVCCCETIFSIIAFLFFIELF